MGAEFRTIIVLDHDAPDRAAVQSKFEQAQDADRHENGHSYSGGIGMAQGLKFESLPPFETEDAAHSWLDVNCVKWEEARAVQFKKESRVHWLIGAWCAS